MPLDLPDGTSCFVDSNVLYYALVPTLNVSPHCIALLDRAIAGHISLLVSVPVLSDVLHKVMTSEVAQLAGRDRLGIIGYLGKHPEVISRLVEYPKTIERLSVVPMTTLPTDPQLLGAATRIAVQHRLLTNDAMIVALMQRHQLAHLVTNDNDFDGVPGITVWKPR
jgi:predicted nucleic acid-binding protein